MRVYDNPNHPHYGPCRRQWVIFASLGLLDTGTNIDTDYIDEWGVTWDDHLVHHLTTGNTEGEALRAIAWNALTVSYSQPPRMVGPWVTIEPDGSITPTKLTK